MPAHNLPPSVDDSHSTASCHLPTSCPPLPVHIKKIRNTKQLSLKVAPSLSETSSNVELPTIHDSTTQSIPMIITPSLPSFPSLPSSTSTSTSLSTRRPFTPAPLKSASLHISSSPSPRIAPTTRTAPSKRQSQLLLDDALPTARLPLSASTHRSISAYFSDYSLECGVASPYTSEPVCVLPNIYLGAEHNATDVSTLHRLGITFVLNVAIEIARENSSTSLSTVPSRIDNDNITIQEGVRFKSLAWTHHQRNLLNDFPAAFALIDEAIAQDNGMGKVLVHCQLGVSRSASLVIAYVMRSLGIGLTEAYDFVKQRSGVISPNMSLMYQLAEYEKSLKNPGGFIASSDSVSDSASVRSRNSWCSQMDDDEPPYPFSAAFSASNSVSNSTSSAFGSDFKHLGTTPSSSPKVSTPFLSSWEATAAATAAAVADSSMLPPPTPLRQEFCKRPLTPEQESEDAPNTKPYQGPGNRGLHSKSFLASRTSRLGLQNQSGAGATSSTRPRYQRSPLTTSSITPDSLKPVETTSLSPKTPTSDSFSFHLGANLFSDVDMIPPMTPRFQTSFIIPSLSSSSASSVSSFEVCAPPRPSISSQISVSSSSTYFTAFDDDEMFPTAADSPSGFGIRSPRSSGTWSLMPVVPHMTSSTDSLVLETKRALELEQLHTLQEHPQQAYTAEPRKKSKINVFWSTLKAFQTTTADTSSPAQSQSSSTATTSSTPNITLPTTTSHLPPLISTSMVTTPNTAMTTTNTSSTNTITTSTTPTTTATSSPSSSSSTSSSSSSPSPSSSRSRIPDFIFSPRPYSYETRSFGEIYQSLRMEGRS